MLNNFKKANVNYSCSSLSRSVACCISACVALRKMSSTALVTANFVERVNCLFNIMNSNDPKTKHKWKKTLSGKTFDQFAFQKQTES